MHTDLALSDAHTAPDSIAVTLNHQPHWWTCSFPDGEPYAAVVELTPAERSCDALVSLVAWPPAPCATRRDQVLWTAEFFWPIAGLDVDQGLAAMTRAGVRPPAASYHLADLMQHSQQAVQTVLRAAAPHSITTEPAAAHPPSLRQAICHQFQVAVP